MDEIEERVAGGGVKEEEDGENEPKIENHLRLRNNEGQFNFSVQDDYFM